MLRHLLTVEEDSDKQRVDIYVSRHLPDAPSRTFVKHLIDSGQVTVNDRPVKAHSKVSSGDIVAVVIEEQLEIEDIQPENIPLDIFYEDNSLLVINKPAGMLVHPVGGCNTGTLVNALIYYCRSEAGTALSDVHPGFRPGIVHRLDRETSGLILVAKDNKAHVRLARQFEKHRVVKRYVALVKGEVQFDEGVIDAPLGRHAVHFDKKAISFDEKSKKATTFYRVLKRFHTNKTLMALYPRTGRTHQLRVHMAHIGHPILGDDKYGDKRSFPRLGLHAQSIGFQHPETRRFVEFWTPVPDDFFS